MNRLMRKAVTCFAMSFWGIGQSYADTARIGAYVIDAITKEPLQGATVRGGFGNDNGWRVWTESAPVNEDFQVTDTSGMCWLRGKTNIGRAGCAVRVPPSGYYKPGQGAGHRFKRKSVLGIWQPDNLVVTIALQRVEHPIPLIVKRVEWENCRKGLLGLQGTNAVLRLDMVKGDWLPPYGHGETSDLEITSELKITGKERRFLRATASEGDVLFYDLVQTIRPTGMDDCISELQSDPTSGIKIRHGSDEGRGARIVRRQGRRKRFSMGGEWYGKRFDDTDENRCYTFRIRSRYDGNGKLAEARYGKIYGDFKFEGHLDRGIISVRFLYYLNPTPLDRNLEWDMKSNLCTNPNLANLPQP